MSEAFVAHWTVPADHPAFPGHFPGRPILPGVVLLDRLLALVSAATGRGVAGTLIANTKFLSPVGPGETLRFAWLEQANGAIRFDIEAGGRAVATGLLTLPAAP